MRGQPLCHWLLKELSDINHENLDTYVDSEEREVYEKVEQDFSDLRFHQRPKWFAEDHANGNHLIHQFAQAYLEYDPCAQIYVKAVGLKLQII